MRSRISLKQETIKGQPSLTPHLMGCREGNILGILISAFMQRDLLEPTTSEMMKNPWLIEILDLN